MDVLDLNLDNDLQPQLSLLLATLDYTTTKWRQELGVVSDEAVVWQPFPGGHSIGAIILHMADVEGYWLQQVVAGYDRSEDELRRLLSEETRQYDVQWPEPPNQPLQWFFDQQDQIRARTKTLLGGIDDPAHIGLNEENRRYTLRRLMAHDIQHEAYHGGQAVLLSVLFDKQRR